MKNSRVTVSLDSVEAEALINIAQKECRQPREQARFILIEELKRPGLLPRKENNINQDNQLKESAP